MLILSSSALDPERTCARSPRIAVAASAWWCRALVNHLVCLQQQRMRHFQPQRLSGLAVNDQIELRGALHRQISGLGALEEAVHIGTSAAIDVIEIRAVRDE